jgi:hypothetical protein
MKKRNLVITAAVVMAMGFLPACDIIEECGTCELVTEDADGNKTYGTPLPFCGDDLTDKDNEPPVTINGITTYWNCY